MEQLGADNLAEQMGDFSKDGDGGEDDDFSHGAPAFPAFFNSMFGGQNNNATNQDNNKKGKKRKKKRTESTSIFTVKTSHARRERAKSTALSAETAKLSV